MAKEWMLPSLVQDLGTGEKPLTNSQHIKTAKPTATFVTVTAPQLNPISAQLSSAWGKQQEDERNCLTNICCSVRHVVQQGQAFRGHTDDSGNLYQPLKLRAEEDDPIVLKWLTEHTTMYTGPKAQNEILNIMANTVS